MDDKEINEIIEKKILEAKLDIAERRLNYLLILAGGLLTVFGMIAPFWLANNSTDKVDKALTDMKTELKSISDNNYKQTERFESKIEKFSDDARSQFKDISQLQNEYYNSTSNKVDKEIQTLDSKFKELAGTQLRKPELICLYRGKSISNAIINYIQGDELLTFEIKNKGDGTAKNVFIRLYFNINKLNTKKNIFVTGDFQPINYSDEDSYKVAFECNLASTSIAATDTQPLKCGIYCDDSSELCKIEKGTSIPAILKIFYDQPEPTVYNFNINF